MKWTTFLTLSLFAPLLSGGQANRQAAVLSIADAGRILGEPVVLADSGTTQRSGSRVFQSAYKARSVDPKTGKRGNLYFLLEQYDAAPPARRKYASIKTANEKNGISTLEGVGDEAYFHSDRQNFYFIMVRTGRNVITMKVNKITANSSLEEFNRVARDLATRL